MRKEREERNGEKSSKLTKKERRVQKKRENRKKKRRHLQLRAAFSQFEANKTRFPILRDTNQAPFSTTLLPTRHFLCRAMSKRRQNELFQSLALSSFELFLSTRTASHSSFQVFFVAQHRESFSKEEGKASGSVAPVNQDFGSERSRERGAREETKKTGEKGRGNEGTKEIGQRRWGEKREKERKRKRTREQGKK